MITLGLVQAASSKELSQNLNTIENFIHQAKEHSCRILCFPECYLTGYSSKDVKEMSINRSHPAFSHLASLAGKYEIDLLVGYMEKETARETYYITHDIFTADSKRYSYRKTHLGDREAKVFTPGNSLDVFSLSCGLTAAIQLCVENHYPEITQTYSLKGAEIVFAPHAVPRIAGDRIKIWSKFIPARSYDNRLYMACCNQWGGCMVTDPAGEIIDAQNTEEDKLFCFSIDENAVKKYHDGNKKMSARYYPGRRRCELYV